MWAVAAAAAVFTLSAAESNARLTEANAEFKAKQLEEDAQVADLNASLATRDRFLQLKSVLAANNAEFSLSGQSSSGNVEALEEFNIIEANRAARLNRLDADITISRNKRAAAFTRDSAELQANAIRLTGLASAAGIAYKGFGGGSGTTTGEVPAPKPKPKTSAYPSNFPGLRPY